MWNKHLVLSFPLLFSPAILQHKYRCFGATQSIALFQRYIFSVPTFHSNEQTDSPLYIYIFFFLRDRLLYCISSQIQTIHNFSSFQIF